MSHSIQLLNTGLAKEIQAMDDDELWKFVLSRLDYVNEAEDRFQFKTWLFLCLNKSFDFFKKRFDELMTDEFEYTELLYTLILDFAFEGEAVRLDYHAIGGFYDNPDSCLAPDEKTVLPKLDEESNVRHRELFFYLLDVPMLDKIIKPLEENAAKTPVETSDKPPEENVRKEFANTPEDIENVKAMRDKCAADERYKVAYIYREGYY